MSRLVSTARGIGVLESGPAGPMVAYLDLDHPDLGAALGAGLPVEEIAAAPRRDRTSLAAAQLLATIPRPSKIWAVGFAYADHRREVGYGEQADAPVIFMKAPSSVLATDGEIRFPRVAPNKVDYEGELGVVIGRRVSGVEEGAARSAIAGYTICNDVSARDVQKGWIPGRKPDVSTAKSFDTFTPMGPCLATLDEFADPDDLHLRTWVDEELRQDARTSQLIHPVSFLVSYLSRHTTLEPGDVICTGTPAGVGHPQGKFLRPGSTVRIEIAGIGELSNVCR